VLREPDLLNLGASVQRAELLERTGVLELGIETAHDVGAMGAIQKIVAHQLAAGNKRALELLAESSQDKDPDIAIKKARASARLMDAFSRSALTRYAHLSHDTLLDATNSVNTALGGMFVPMVSASPAAQVQLVQ
jgi:hypothetical protein